MLNAGADKVSFNTAAIHNLVTCWMNARTVLVRSARYWRLMRVEKSMGLASLYAWRAQPDRTGCSAVGDGVQSAGVLLTSMDADGTKAGFDLELTRIISETVPVPVIASGGAGTLAHMAEAVSGVKPMRC